MSKTQEWSSGRDESVCSAHVPYEAFWSAWEVHRELLYRLSLRWMKGNSADAEDALSAAKIKAIRHFCCLASDIHNERAWLIRLLYTSCVDMMRRRSREDAGAEVGKLLDAGDAPSDGPSPEERFLQREEWGRVSELFDELPEPWRDALLERCLHRRSYQEIARESGTTQANIRKRVQLARAFLRQRLDS